MDKPRIKYNTAHKCWMVFRNELYLTGGLPTVFGATLLIAYENHMMYTGGFTPKIFAIN